MKPGDYTRNPHYFLAAFTIKNPWVLWAITRSGMFDEKRRAPTEDDVLEPETVKLLPRPVRLKRIPRRLDEAHP